jgi:hypothetical protein
MFGNITTGITGMKKLFLILLFVLAPMQASSEVIFEDNFNYAWQPTNIQQWAHFYPSGDLENYEPSSYAAGERTNSNSWNGYLFYGDNTIEITETGGHTGGCLVVGYDNTSPMQQVGLIKWLGYPTHDALYVRWRFKFDDQWCWGNGTNGSMTYFKTIRMVQGVDLLNLNGKSPTTVLDYPYSIVINWNEDNDGPFQPSIMAKFINNTPTDVCNNTYTGPPCNMNQWQSNSAGWFSTLISPFENGCVTETQTWHTIEHYVQPRSTISVEDAVYRVWVDGVEITDPSDPWDEHPYMSLDGGQISWIVLADNGTGGNYWDGMRYLYIDDFVVSTEYIGPTYAVGSEISAYSTGTLRSSGGTTFGNIGSGGTTITIH